MNPTSTPFGVFFILMRPYTWIRVPDGISLNSRSTCAHLRREHFYPLDMLRRAEPRLLYLVVLPPDEVPHERQPLHEVDRVARLRGAEHGPGARDEPDLIAL